MPRVSPKRLAALLTAALAVFSFCRVSVLFFESISAVRADREADAELLDICKSGAARGSTKMRAACLQARADRASPLLFKAVVRAVHTAWSEFTETVGTPFGFATVVLFLLSGFVMPVMPWLKTMAWNAEEEQVEPDDEERHVIVLAGENSRGGVRRRVARLLRGPPRSKRLDGVVELSPAYNGFNDVPLVTH